MVFYDDRLFFDHCRIGSLERNPEKVVNDLVDHCRIGSLEKDVVPGSGPRIDHCRIGSLEIQL